MLTLHKTIKVLFGKVSKLLDMIRRNQNEVDGVMSSLQNKNIFLSPQHTVNSVFSGKMPLYYTLKKKKLFESGLPEMLSFGVPCKQGMQTFHQIHPPIRTPLLGTEHRKYSYKTTTKHTKLRTAYSNRLY